MQLINRHFIVQHALLALLSLLFLSLPLMALESDRQETLLVDADYTDGTLGDGVTTLWGNVDIRQGTLHITAEKAEVNKTGGSVKSVTLSGKPAFLEQEIEAEGLVKATANIIDYQVASGLVTLTGNADVQHPQYQISGELLTYDLNIQHFQGSSDANGNGRIHIRLDPEVIDDAKEKKDQQSEDEPTSPLPDEQPSDPKQSDTDGN